MTKVGNIYKCPICGNIIEVVHSGGPIPFCCGKEMVEMVANTVDAAKEKHVPVIEKVAGGYLVKVGSVPHPMEAEHWIEWIELSAGNASYKVYLKPGDKPEAFFATDASAVTAREYCNKHGLWKA